MSQSYPLFDKLKALATKEQNVEITFNLKGIGEVKIQFGASYDAEGNASINANASGDKSFGFFSAGGRLGGACTLTGNDLQCILEAAVTAGAKIDLPGDNFDKEFGFDTARCEFQIGVQRIDKEDPTITTHSECAILPDAQEFIQQLSKELQNPNAIITAAMMQQSLLTYMNHSSILLN